MANKRQRKKQQKKVLQQRVAQDYTGKKRISNLSIAELEQESKRQADYRRAKKLQKEREYKRSLYERKYNALKKKNIDVSKLTKKQIMSLKVKDIQNDNITKYNYPQFYGLHMIDFNKVYSLGANKMYLAFRDFTGETSLEEIISEFSNMSDADLLANLEYLVNLPTRGGGRKGSNGVAGDYKFIIAPQAVIEDFQRDTYNKNRRKKTRLHKGQYKGYQVLKHGRYSGFKNVTPHNMLVLANAIMSHVTEQDRLNFYQRFYIDMGKYIPEFAEILPTP